jgi:hypothetical protein
MTLIHFNYVWNVTHGKVFEWDIKHAKVLGRIYAAHFPSDISVYMMRYRNCN